MFSLLLALHLPGRANRDTSACSTSAIQRICKQWFFMDRVL